MSLLGYHIFSCRYALKICRKLSQRNPHYLLFFTYFQDSLKTKSKKRLRSGADCSEKPQPTTADSSLVGKQNTKKKLEDGENRSKVADPIVYSNKQIGIEKNRDMNKVLENITMKLDKIERNLRAINESL